METEELTRLVDEIYKVNDLLSIDRSVRLASSLRSLLPSRRFEFPRTLLVRFTRFTRILFGGIEEDQPRN